MPDMQSQTTSTTEIYISLELSQATWLVTALTPGSDKVSRHASPGGDCAALMALLNRLRARRPDRQVRIVAIQEAGLDGFCVYRVLQRHSIESHVVDAGSIAVPRQRRRAKTDAIDGETLLRTLLAWKRGEPRACAMVVPPTPEQEDQRSSSRERAALMRERVRHVNRIKGLLAGQGITGYEPLRADRRARLAALTTGDGRSLRPRPNAGVGRELDVLELLLKQIAEVSALHVAAIEIGSDANGSPTALLARLKGIGPRIAAVLWFEGLYRSFNNRREVASYDHIAHRCDPCQDFAGSARHRYLPRTTGTSLQVPQESTSPLSLVDKAGVVWRTTAPVPSATVQIARAGPGFPLRSRVHSRPLPPTPTSHADHRLPRNPVRGIQCLAAGNLRSASGMIDTATGPWRHAAARS